MSFSPSTVTPAVANASATSPPSDESFHYIPVEADHLYAVHHRAARREHTAPRGCVLIAGPIGAERERAYRTLVLLARGLALLGFDVLRFDFRGIGESTGHFPTLSFSEWQSDIVAAASHLRHLSPNAPLLLLGLRGGTLPISRAFSQGLGDAMLLLSPPKSGTDHLQDILRRNLMADLIANPTAPRRTREEIAQSLDSGESVNIDGYWWSRSLWQNAPHHHVHLPAASELRRWHILDFKGLPPTAIAPSLASHRTTITTERFWEASPLLLPQSSAFQEAVLALAATLCTAEKTR